MTQKYRLNQSKIVARGSCLYWLGISPQNIFEYIGWNLSRLFGFFRFGILMVIQTSKMALWFTIGLLVNIIISLIFAGLFSFFGHVSIYELFFLGMSISLFLSLIALVRIGEPAFTTIVFGAIPNRESKHFRQNLIKKTENIAKSALDINDNYRAVARYWYAKRYAVVQLVAYILLGISQLSVFMTCIIIYLDYKGTVSQKDAYDLFEIFFYYWQLGFDSCFFNTLDLAGIKLSNITLIEHFSLRIIRFSIYTLYLGRIAGYIFDLIKLNTDSIQEQLHKRIKSSWE